MKEASKLRVNIVYGDNGQGLTHDGRILREVLTSLACKVTLSPQSPRKLPIDVRFTAEHLVHAARVARDRSRFFLGALGGRPRWDLNLFIASIDRDYLPLARVNWLLPNQEWLTEQDCADMARVTRVLFKTHHAAQLLRHAAPQSTFVGFTSEDRLLPSTIKHWHRALHVAGWNPLKGTKRLLELWQQHPQWPHLSVVAQNQAIPSTRHIDVISQRVSDTHLRVLQNTCGMHIAPSEVEGFGHSLNEALSCGAILITTNAPPMNEVASSEAAVLVDVEATEPMASGMRYKFAVHALASAVQCVLDMTDTECRRMSAAARDAYETGRRRFVSRLSELISSI